MKTSNFFVEESEFFKRRMIELLAENIREIQEGHRTIAEVINEIRTDAERVNLPERFIQNMINYVCQRVPSTLNKPMSR